MKHTVVAGATPAFSLVEVVLALGVTSFCLMALFGLLSVGLNNNRGTIEQAGATAILSAAMSDLYATPPTVPPGASTNSVQFGIKIPANPVTAVASSSVTTLYFSASGLTTNSTAAQSAYRLTVTPLVPTSPTSPTRVASFFDLLVSWPAAASISNAAGSAETFVSLNRN